MESEIYEIRLAGFGAGSDKKRSLALLSKKIKRSPKDALDLLNNKSMIKKSASKRDCLKYKKVFDAIGVRLLFKMKDMPPVSFEYPSAIGLFGKSSDFLKVIGDSNYSGDWEYSEREKIFFRKEIAKSHFFGVDDINYYSFSIRNIYALEAHSDNSGASLGKYVKGAAAGALAAGGIGAIAGAVLASKKSSRVVSLDLNNGENLIGDVSESVYKYLLIRQGEKEPGVYNDIRLEHVSGKKYTTAFFVMIALMIGIPIIVFLVLLIELILKG